MLTEAPERTTSVVLVTPRAATLFAQGCFTALLVVGPIVTLAVCVPLLWGGLLTARDVALAIALYAITGHGITVGYHRLFTHRSSRRTDR